jgi:hypothetical protein
MINKDTYVLTYINRNTIWKCIAILTFLNYMIFIGVGIAVYNQTKDNYVIKVVCDINNCEYINEEYIEYELTYKNISKEVRMDYQGEFCEKYGYIECYYIATNITTLSEERPNTYYANKDDALKTLFILVFVIGTIFEVIIVITVLNILLWRNEI